MEFSTFLCSLCFAIQKGVFYDTVLFLFFVWIFIAGCDLCYLLFLSLICLAITSLNQEVILKNCEYFSKHSSQLSSCINKNFDKFRKWINKSECSVTHFRWISMRSVSEAKAQEFVREIWMIELRSFQDSSNSYEIYEFIDQYSSISNINYEPVKFSIYICSALSRYPIISQFVPCGLHFTSNSGRNYKCTLLRMSHSFWSHVCHIATWRF